MILANSGLVIDWANMPTYNTIMSISAGSALMSLVSFARELKSGRDVQLEPWSIALGVPGFILTVTGIHMTLVWPLAKYFPYDDIIFGETSFAFGAILVAAAFYLWKRAERMLANRDVATAVSVACRPSGLFIVGLGLALLAIAAAGLNFRLFAAPAEEPISGAFAAHPWIEAIFMSTLFGLVGVGAILFPIALRNFSTSGTTLSQSIVGWVWTIGGLGFFLFGALNFYTHIGLILHTMG